MTHVGLGIPSNYKQHAREDSKRAAESVGLKVIGLFHEPSAGAWGNRAHERGDGLILILDLGGGTFDVSIVKVSGNAVEVIATNGVQKLGGMDYHQRLLEHCLGEFEAKCGFKPTLKSHPIVLQEMYHRVEQTKLMLTARETTQIPVVCDGKAVTVDITRKEFAELTEDLTQKAMECAEKTLKESGIQTKDIREVMVIGGAGLMPCFREEVEKHFEKPPSQHCEPHLAVALGTAMLGRIEIEKEGGTVSGESGRALPPSGLHSREITSHPIGVCVKRKDEKLVNSVVIPKAKRIPCDITEYYQLAELGQTGAGIQLLQGPENAAVEDCQILGEGELDGLPAIYDEPHKIEIRVRFDKNGVITATAYDPLCGRSVDIVVAYKNKKDGKHAA